jgi:hypothetical protein
MPLRAQKVKLKYRHPILLEKDRIAREMFMGRCFWCGKKYGSGFAFHHLNYKAGRLTYSSFKDTVNYHKYLIPEILASPERFGLLCKAHHHFVEIFAAIKDEQKWLRFFLLVMCTDGDKGGESSPSRSTAICLENDAVEAYHLNNNSSLKKLLTRFTDLDSMFGDIRFESK